MVFGNSGSGKSTLAQQLCAQENLPHLDLDTLAWLPTNPPQRKTLSESREFIEYFMNSAQAWVIEGCYTDLLEIAVGHANELVYLSVPVETCIENARKRPWEPHKYASRAEQDANLGMLLDWIAQYPTRVDVFSQSAHDSLYEKFTGKKRMYTSNARNE